MNVHQPSHPSSDPWPTAPLRKAVSVDPIVLQIVEGTLNSIEAEIEYAIERTARSPMIREAHDFRVGLFDRYCRKLTGRSYSAMPNAVVRDFPPETMKPGDVFLMNDTYLTEGSIGHLPDLCSTVPVFHEGEIVAYIQAFGHHDDVGGRVPGSMPGTAATVFDAGCCQFRRSSALPAKSAMTRLSAIRGDEYQPVQVLQIVGAVALALAVGVIAGLYPAMRATRLSPTEALRTI